MKDKSKSDVIFWLVIAIIIFPGLWTAVKLAHNTNTYVSDEVWYVSAARTLLTNNGIQLKSVENGMQNIVVIFPEGTSPEFAIDLIFQRLSFLNLNTTDSIEITFLPVSHQFVIKVPVEYAKDVLNIMKNTPLVNKVYMGYPYPDERGIYEYQNLEHPPTGKLLIALSMIIFGDKPFYWRIPSLIAGLITILGITLIVKKTTSSYVAAGIAALLLVSSKNIIEMSSVAMLDIFVAMFLVLATYFSIDDKYDFALIFVALAVTTKLSAVAALVMFLILILIKYDLDTMERYALASVLVIIVFMIPSFILVGSFKKVIASLGSSMFWHLSSKGGHAMSTTPGDWLWGRGLWILGDYEGFPRYIYVPAPLLWLYLITIPHTITGKSKPVAFYSFGMFAFFVVLYFFGTTTQFAFYYTEFEPLVIASLSIALSKIQLFKFLEKAEGVPSYRRVILDEIKKNTIGI